MPSPVSPTPPPLDPSRPVDLFSPLSLRGLELRNRIAVAPMCEYSSEEGLAGDWHLVHLGTRAVGGAGLVISEAAAVSPEGRISPQDLGLWSDAHADALRPAVDFVRRHGAAFGVQLAHAGRKGSTLRPWDGEGVVAPAEGGWTPVAPSAIPFADHYPRPTMLDELGINKVVEDFRAAARRADRIGVDLVEVHAAHGYLLAEFLSPLSNRREDRYGGNFENRTRFLREVVAAVREVWPAEKPLLVRLSATEWVDGGWDLEDTVRLAPELRELGVDLVDCSSGGNVAQARIPVGSGYQTALAARVRQAGVMTGAVGLITEAVQADTIVRTGQADLVLLARELLRQPYWPLHAARTLHREAPVPDQYLRAF